MITTLHGGSLVIRVVGVAVAALLAVMLSACEQERPAEGGQRTETPGRVTRTDPDAARMRRREFRCGEKIESPVQRVHKGLRFVINRIGWPAGGNPWAQVALHASASTMIQFPIGPTEPRLLLLKADVIVGGHKFPEPPPTAEPPTPTITAPRLQYITIDKGKPYRFTVTMTRTCPGTGRDVLAGAPAAFEFVVVASAWTIPVSPNNSHLRDPRYYADPLLVARVPARNSLTG